METFKFILKTKIQFLLLICMIVGSSLFGQETQRIGLQEIRDSIEVLNKKNETIKYSNSKLNDSAQQMSLRTKEMEDNISELSKLNYKVGQSILSYYIGGGLSTFQYKPTLGERSGELGFTTGLSYSYFWNSNWGIKLGISLDHFGSSLKISNLETSTPSTDGDTDNDGIPDPFNLLTRYSNLKEKQEALLIGTALELSYRTKLSDRWDFIGSIGPKVSFTAKSESFVTEGSYTTSGHYPQYGSETILPVGQGFETYTPRDREDNDLGLGISLVADMDFAYKINQGYSIYVGPYFEYQLNRETNGSERSLVSYEASLPVASESVYNSVLNSNAINNFNRYALGLRVGINFDLGGHKNHRKEKAIGNYEDEMGKYTIQKQLYEDQLNKNKLDSIDNAKRIKELRSLFDQQRAQEKADSISNALRRAELARLAEEQRVRDSIENANKVGVIMDIRTKQLSEDDLEILKLPIVFEFGTAELTEKSKENVNIMAEMLAKYPTLQFQVTGHTCDIGSDQANYIVGMRRATVIKDAFAEGGTESSHIKTFSKGKSEPLVPNINEENRRQNRRVVVVIED